MKRLLIVAGLLFGFASPALAAEGTYKGQMIDHSGPGATCYFAGDITLTLAGSVLKGVPAHAPPFSTTMQGTHAEVAVSTKNGGLLTYTVDQSGGTITGTYRLDKGVMAITGSRAPKGHCEGMFTANLQEPEGPPQTASQPR